MSTSKYLAELTQRLLGAIDQSCDVINMAEVLAVISALEGTAVTKEQLETTRLAKYVNQLRKRTRNEHLAKRAKSLLKRWREMVGMQQAASGDASISMPLNDIMLLPTPTPTPPPTTTPNIANSQLANTKSANLNVNKRLDVAAIGNSSNNSKTSVPIQQPTSFANLIPNNNNNIGYCNEAASTWSAMSSSNKRSTTIARNNRSGAGLVDVSSNSNSIYAGMRHNKPVQTVLDPIVIDIQDSNSDTEDNAVTATTATVATASKTFDCMISPPAAAMAAATACNNSKKSKRDKKARKEQNNKSQNSSKIQTSDESSQQHMNHFKLFSKDNDRFAKQELTMQPANTISEILSLSNSSMGLASSMADNTSKTAAEHDKSQLNCSSTAYRQSLNSSDLTFAGKFNQNTCDATFAVSANEHSAAATRLPTAKTTTTNNFMPFSSCFNDSNSQSSCMIATNLSNAALTTNIASNFLSSQQANTATDIPEAAALAGAATATIVSYPAYVDIDNTHSQSQLDCLTQQQQQQQTAVSSQENKVPKKRGRKKGSKGVDSVIAKETSLSSQILVTSLACGGGKKVKTTRELIAEMQNRKMQQQQQALLPSRPASSCSEPSLLSPQTLDAAYAKNTAQDTFFSVAEDAESGSDTVTSEPSRDSASLDKKLQVETCCNTNATTTTATAANAALFKLLQELPAIKKIDEIEAECAAETVPCSCQIIEILPNTAAAETAEDDDKLAATAPSNAITEQVNVASNMTAVKSVVNEEMLHIKREDTTENIEKPKKSIFDLDFDEDEDPINLLHVEVAENFNSNDTNDSDFLLATNINGEHQQQQQPQTAAQFYQQQQQHVEQQQQQPAITMPILPNYKIEEAENCVAKQRFQIQTQKITQFHINALHNCFIPNVNGNWANCIEPTLPQAQQHANVNSNSNIEQFQHLNAIELTAKLAEFANDENFQLMPSLGSLLLQPLRKDLSHLDAILSQKPKKPTNLMRKLRKVPFLGVARTKSQIAATRSCKMAVVADEFEQTPTTTNANVLQNITVDVSDNSSPSHNMLQPQQQTEIINVNSTAAGLLAIVHANDMKSSQCIEATATTTTDFQQPVNVALDAATAAATIAKDTALVTDALTTTDTLTASEAATAAINTANQPQKNNSNFAVSQFSSQQAMTTHQQQSLQQQKSTEQLSQQQQASTPKSPVHLSQQLPQQQQSITLKLRRRRQQSNSSNTAAVAAISCNNRKRKRCRNKTTANTIKLPPKVRKIKRLKISLNGNVITQRQDSYNSSINNSSDDDMAYDAKATAAITDRESAATAAAAAKQNYFQIVQCSDDQDDNDEQDDVDIASDADDNDDDDDDSSANSYNEPLAEYNIVMDDVAEHDSMHDDSDNDDFDNNYSEDNDYEIAETADYDEVVLPTNGIVLKFKKTSSSRNNSPSNSLSAMSPITLKNNNNNNNNDNNSSSNKTITTLANSPPTLYEMPLETLNGTTPAPEQHTHLQQHEEQQQQQQFEENEQQQQQQEQHTVDDLNAMLNITACSNSSNINISVNATNYSSSAVTVTSLQSAIAVTAQPGNFAVNLQQGSAAQLNHMPVAAAITTTTNSCLPAATTTATTANILTATKHKADRKSKRLYQQLFFADEDWLLTTNENCSSSSEDDDDIYEQQQQQQVDNNICIENVAAATTLASSADEEEEEQNDVADDSDDAKELLQLQLKQLEQQQQQLILDKGNNMLLQSFNNIYYAVANDDVDSDDDDEVDAQQKPEHLQAVIKTQLAAAELNTTAVAVGSSDNVAASSCSNKIAKPKLLPYKEYISGQRAVDEDVQDEDGNNCARLQQFKEWHQILQLRSYNDEVLTVLPYVVLN